MLKGKWHIMGGLCNSSNLWGMKKGAKSLKNKILTEWWYTSVTCVNHEAKWSAAAFYGLSKQGTEATECRVGSPPRSLHTSSPNWPLSVTFLKLRMKMNWVCREYGYADFLGLNSLDTISADLNNWELLFTFFDKYHENQRSESLTVKIL